MCFDTGNPNGANVVRNPDGTTQTFEYTRDGELVYGVQNPGQIDLATVNPALYQEIERLRALRESANFDRFLDPNYNADRRVEEMQAAEIGAGNQYARMGLAGSSAGISGAADASRRAGYAFDDRLLDMQLRAMQGDAAMSQMISGGIMAGQAGYGAYQQQILGGLQSIWAGNAQAMASEMGMWGDIISGIFTAGGQIAGSMAKGAGGGAPAGRVAEGSGGGGMPMTPIGSTPIPAGPSSGPFEATPINPGPTSYSVGSRYLT